MQSPNLPNGDRSDFRGMDYYEVTTHQDNVIKVYTGETKRIDHLGEYYNIESFFEEMKREFHAANGPYIKNGIVFNLRKTLEDLNSSLTEDCRAKVNTYVDSNSEMSEKDVEACRSVVDHSHFTLFGDKYDSDKRMDVKKNGKTLFSVGINTGGLGVAPTTVFMKLKGRMISEADLLGRNKTLVVTDKDLAQLKRMFRSEFGLKSALIIVKYLMVPLSLMYNFDIMVKPTMVDNGGAKKRARRSDN